MKQRSAHYLPVGIAIPVLIVGIALTMGSSDSYSAKAAPATRTERVVIGIEGMHCEGCAAGIKAMLKRTTGVISADVNYKQREAIVHYDPEKVTREKIVEAITKLGYKAHVKG